MRFDSFSSKQANPQDNGDSKHLRNPKSICQMDIGLDDHRARLVLFAYGNPSRGDDALGPELLIRLGEETIHHTDLCRSVTDFQLQIEHAQDLLSRDLALFVDASMTSPPPFSFHRLSPRRDTSYTSHAMSPAALLYVFEQAYGSAPPPAFMLSIRGEDFTLGRPVSATAVKHLDAAIEFARQLIECPDSECWNTRVFKKTLHSAFTD